MADLELVLQAVADTGGVDSLELASKLNTDHQKVVGAVKSLQSHEDVSSCCCSIYFHGKC